MIADFLAPFFRLGLVMWALVAFVASFLGVHRVMVMNDINPLSNTGGVVPVIAFFSISLALFAFATLVGFIVFRSVFSLIED